jgi:MFS family permease
LRRYVALGVVGLSLAIAYGIWYSYSVILVALLAEFGWSRSVLAGAFSVFTLVHGGFNALVGALCARFPPLGVMAVGGAAMGLALFLDSFIASPLELYLFFGVVTAVAVATGGWIPSLVYVQRAYQDRLGFSIGIVSSGVGVGLVLVVPLTQLLIDAYGWRTAFRGLGVLAVVWIVPSSIWLMRQTEIRGQSPNSSPPTRGQNSGSDPMTLRQAARTQPFWLLVAAFFFGNWCSQTLHVHQVAYLVDYGVAAIVAASVVSVVGLASIVAKTGGGWLSDRVERELVYVTGIAIMVASAFVLLSLGTNPSPLGAYGYAILLGAGYSVTAALTPAMVSDRFSGRHFGAIVGIGLMGAAVGSALGPWVAGTLYDATGSYTIPFLIAAGCGVVAGLAGWRVRSLKNRGQTATPAGPADKIGHPMNAVPAPIPDPEATADGGFVLGELSGRRQLLSRQELAANLTEMIRGCEGCENVTVLEVYRIDPDSRDGCNWSLAILLDPAGVAPEVYALAYGAVMGTARATWNLDDETGDAALDLEF